MTDDLLLISGDETLTAAWSAYLAGERFSVTCIGSWKTAADCLNDFSEGIIIVDLETDDGADRGEVLRFKSKKPHIPMIIVTEPGNLESAMEQFQAHALHYLVKPFKKIELDIALRHARERLGLYRKLNINSQQIEELHLARTLYQQLFDEVPCYISVQDRQFRLTATNRMFKRDFGEQIGDHCYKIYKHRNSPCPECPVAKTFEDGRSHQTEEVVTSRSARQYNVLTWTAAIRNEHDEITQVMEMATNITQIRRLQDHLTSLGLMLGSMSHGVKGMLTALDGGVYQLETGIRNNDRKRIELAFDRIQQMVGRIRKMVLEILFYAKSRGMQFETTPVRAFVQMVAQIVEPTMNKHGIAFNLEVAPETGEFEIDPTWFQQALVNFLENAVDACVIDQDKPAHRIEFAVRSDGEDMVTIAVGDDGIGMDEETRQKIFTLFFSSKGSKGTGLGLFIANHVVRQHGGSIEIDSDCGKGTLINIRIPRRQTVGVQATDPCRTPGAPDDLQ